MFLSTFANCFAYHQVNSFAEIFGVADTANESPGA